MFEIGLGLIDESLGLGFSSGVFVGLCQGHHKSEHKQTLNSMDDNRSSVFSSSSDFFLITKMKVQMGGRCEYEMEEVVCMIFVPPNV